VDTIKDQQKTENETNPSPKSETVTGLYVKFRVKLPLDTDLSDPAGANIRVSREVMATLIQMKQHFPGIEFDFKRETSLPWINVPLNESDL
jgi:hypothetical protein